MHYEVILDTGETPNKCTIASLSYRPDFTLIPVRGKATFAPLRSPILLHHEGECLLKLRESAGPINGIACIDSIWRRLESILHRIETPLPILARIPDGFVTAYPRTSKQNTDPSSGLATIEALFVAAAIVGKWDVSLLSQYYFGRRFIELNMSRFQELQISTGPLPIFSHRPKHALQRRHDRGKL